MGSLCLMPMDENKDMSSILPSGDDFIKMLEALANPHRLQILSLLTGRRIYVSQLAREMEMSRPLLYMHLKRLENAGLVTSSLELSEDGKAMNYYEITTFHIQLNPENIAEITKTLTIKKSGSEGKRK
jgi:DNA-binding transcriptional ArsR family regulator